MHTPLHIAPVSSLPYLVISLLLDYLPLSISGCGFGINFVHNIVSCMGPALVNLVHEESPQNMSWSGRLAEPYNKYQLLYISWLNKVLLVKKNKVSILHGGQCFRRPRQSSYRCLLFIVCWRSHCYSTCCIWGDGQAATICNSVCVCEGIRNWVAAKVISDQPGSPKTAKEDENLPKGESVTLFRSLKDAPRAVDRLLLAPRSPLIAPSCQPHTRFPSCTCSWLLHCDAVFTCCINMLLLICRGDMSIIAIMCLESNLCLPCHILHLCNSNTTQPKSCCVELLLCLRGRGEYIGVRLNVQCPLGKVRF